MVVCTCIEGRVGPGNRYIRRSDFDRAFNTSLSEIAEELAITSIEEMVLKLATGEVVLIDLLLPLALSSGCHAMTMEAAHTSRSFISLRGVVGMYRCVTPLRTHVGLL